MVAKGKRLRRFAMRIGYGSFRAKDSGDSRVMNSKRFVTATYNCNHERVAVGQQPLGWKSCFASIIVAYGWICKSLGYVFVTATV
jgi:hypothetical protein